MDRLSEIRARCERATREEYPEKVYGSAAYYCVTKDIPFLLAEVERLQGKLQDQEYQILLDAMEQSRDEAIARAEKAEAADRWIPVGERIPENTGRYLTVYISTVYKGNNPKKHVGELDWAGKECGWLINGLYDVTHWRPLPDPPKGE